MTTEMRWWRPVAGSCHISLDKVHTPVGTVYFVTLTDDRGEMHRLQNMGLYWMGQDFRIRNTKPAVGKWEEAPDPAEPLETFSDIDISELTKPQEGNNQ